MNSNYQPVDADEHEITSPSPDYTHSPHPIASSTLIPHINSQRAQATHAQATDAVFSNLAPKQKAFEELEPPSYSSAVHPATTDITFVPSITQQFLVVGEDGEILVEGMEVGGLFILFINMLISMTFDLVGFFLTSILARTHAARAGSRLGLGLTLTRYALYLQQSSDDAYDDQHKLQKEWTGYVLFFFGILIILHSNAEYFRVVRVRGLIVEREVTGGVSVV